jgi:hypothetical protein
MALLTVQTIDDLGASVTFAAAAGGGDTAPNDGKTAIIVRNGSGASINVTLTPVLTAATLPTGTTATVASRVIAVPAGGAGMIAGLAPAFFNNASGQVAITYSAVTTVTVAVVKISNY